MRFVAILSSWVLSATYAFGLAVPTNIKFTCETGGKLSASDFTLNNEFGPDPNSTTYISQCIYLLHERNNTINWQALWTWDVPVLSLSGFPNAALNFSPVLLSTVDSIPSTWKWGYYSPNEFGAAVAYRALFSGTDPGNGHPASEVQIRLDAGTGFRAASNNQFHMGQIPLYGTVWDLYRTVGAWSEYTFMPQKSVPVFHGDLKPFFTILAKKVGFLWGQQLYRLEAGTEPYFGREAWFTVESLSLSMNLKAT